jgi:hypothetical protein
MLMVKCVVEDGEAEVARRILAIAIGKTCKEPWS